LLYSAQSKYTEAESLFKPALAIYKQQLGLQHPYTAQCLNDLAELYSSQGKYIEAEPLFKQALVIREQQLGSQHPDTVATSESYARLQQKMACEVEVIDVNEPVNEPIKEKHSKA
jgi:tetratricopeptide (TPR) repeat protein